MLPNVEQQTATPQQAITNSNEKGKGGISHSQPCLICRLPGNCNVPLVCCVVCRCAGLWKDAILVFSTEGEWGLERWEKKRESKPNKKRQIAQSWYFVYTCSNILNLKQTFTCVDPHAVRWSSVCYCLELSTALQPPQGRHPDNTN